MPTIKPTIGRKVWVWVPSELGVKDVRQPFDATIIYVRDEFRVDVEYTDHYGAKRIGENLLITPPEFQAEGDNSAHGVGDRHRTGPAYATWMPFQMGQAKAPPPPEQPQLAATAPVGTAQFPQDYAAPQGTSVAKTYTFEEFIEYGRKMNPSAVDSAAMPWHFQFEGHPVTHENDDVYLINLGDTTLVFNRGETLQVFVDGTLASRAAPPTTPHPGNGG